jgi:hypothetical protein
MTIPLSDRGLSVISLLRRSLLRRLATTTAAAVGLSATRRLVGQSPPALAVAQPASSDAEQVEFAREGIQTQRQGAVASDVKLSVQGEQSQVPPIQRSTRLPVPHESRMYGVGLAPSLCAVPSGWYGRYAIQTT